jgi:hypothetical protein
MSFRELEALGPPHLQIASLRVWVHGRQFPDARDYWDGNWLRVTACCSNPNSSVQTQGPLVHLGEIVGLRLTLKKLYESLGGEAALKCIEPNLDVSFVASSTGHVEVRISITPDQMTEEHVFRETIDQSYLPPMISACEDLLALYPIREAELLPKHEEDA